MGAPKRKAVRAFVLTLLCDARPAAPIARNDLISCICHGELVEMVLMHVKPPLLKASKHSVLRFALLVHAPAPRAPTNLVWPRRGRRQGCLVRVILPALHVPPTCFELLFKSPPRPGGEDVVIWHVAACEAAIWEAMLGAIGEAINHSVLEAAVGDAMVWHQSLWRLGTCLNRIRRKVHWRRAYGRIHSGKVHHQACAVVVAPPCNSRTNHGMPHAGQRSSHWQLRSAGDAHGDHLL
mmetsp:Transcript_51009/g.122052  ORF Transcript_51009/g.122052 Transcript_51009/m.122052 type:complete len:237 (-) Transcript_51009:799-1509(-)